MESGLLLSWGGFPPLSARGCFQKLMPVLSGNMRRTINGKLVYTGDPVAHKYRSLILCEDRAPVALEGLWRGSEVRVGCIQRLWQEASGRDVLLEREPIIGSVFAITAHQEKVEGFEVIGRNVTFSKRGPPEVFVSYRPWLDMRLLMFSLYTREWDMKVGWKLELEEV